MAEGKINQTLITHVQGGHGIETARAVQEFFENMELPIPQHGEFTVTTDFGFLVFLNESGCVLRLTWEDMEHFDNEHILQPLVSKQAGDMRIELFPGVPSPTSFEDSHKLKNLLELDNLDFFDYGRMNCGYLPHITDREGNPVPVVIDQGAVFSLTESVQEVKNILPAEKRPDLQDQLYKPLKDAFNKAWPEHQAAPDSALIKAFWEQCRQAKTEGTLTASWLKNRDNFKNILRGSRLYEKRWNAAKNQP